MKPLHASYHNLGSWTMVGEPGASEFRIVYHAFPVIASAVFLFLLCMAGAALLHFTLPPSVEMKGVAVGFVAATGIAVPAIMAAYAVSRSKKGPLLTYRASRDILLVSEPPLEISNAYQRVSFSRERFYDGEYRHEFNLVVDGERKKFLSSSDDSFSKISGFVGEMGFYVSEHKIKL